MPAPPPRMPQRTELPCVVFVAGVAMLGIEMLMPRLLAPYFGTAQPIWAIIISSTLLFLAAGYWLGGRLADHDPRLVRLYRLLAWAGLACALIPLVARPILRTARLALLDVAAGTFLAALGGAVLLFAVPVTLLAAVSPLAVRLHLHHSTAGVQAAGRVVGLLSAVSTIGALLGTLLTAFWLIPNIGTTASFYLFALVLLVLATLGGREWFTLPLIVLVGGLGGYVLNTPAPIAPAACIECVLVAEAESAYNYIQVVEQYGFDADGIDPRLHLLLNEGFALHSTYRLRYRERGDPADLLTGGGPWDYFMIAPFVQAHRTPQSIQRVAILGAAAGTVPKQLLAVYGTGLHLDAVELDPAIIAISRTYFDLDADQRTAPNYHVHVADARAWLATQPPDPRGYDLIGVDAYQQPYIPFHLTTVEFFAELRAHLAPDGVVVVNAARAPNGDERLVRAVATSMRAVFPQVFLIDTHRARGSTNVLVIGVPVPVGDGAAHLAAHAAQLGDPTLVQVLQWALFAGAQPVREFVPQAADPPPFTDDRAPLEQLVDALLMEQLGRQ